MNIRLNGWTNINGYLEIDASSGNDQLVYNFTSGATKGLKVDQAVSLSPTIAPSLSLNMMSNMIHQSDDVILMHAKKMITPIKFAELRNDTTSSLKKSSSWSPWTQVFGQKATYDGHSSSNGNVLSAGYDSDFYGMVVGYDRPYSKNTLTGF